MCGRFIKKTLARAFVKGGVVVVVRRVQRLCLFG
jgi:hypothetical protein